MRMFIVLAIFLLAAYKGNSQIVYMDLVKDQAIRSHGLSIRDRIGVSRDRLAGIRNQGAVIQTQLNAIKKTHEKFQKGLREVSSLITDGLTTKSTVEMTADILREINKTRQLATRYPQYVMFANQAINHSQQRVLRLSGYITSLINTNGQILMDAGERKSILNMINIEVRLLRASIYNINYSIERAAKIGFFKSINPFNRYVHRDANIMRRIMEDASAFK